MKNYEAVGITLGVVAGIYLIKKSMNGGPVVAGSGQTFNAVVKVWNGKPIEILTQGEIPAARSQSDRAGFEVRDAKIILL